MSLITIKRAELDSASKNDAMLEKRIRKTGLSLRCLAVWANILAIFFVLWNTQIPRSAFITEFYGKEGR